MVKKTFIFTLSILFLCVNNIFAGFIGCPIETIGKGQWSITAEAERMQDRDLVSPSSTDSTTTGVVNERNVFAGQITYGIIDELDIYLKLGTSDLKVDTKWSDGSRTKLDYGDSNVYGIGIKYIYTYENNFFIGGDLQFAVTEGGAVEKIRENSIEAIITKNGAADLSEYQLSFFCGQKYSLFKGINATPYAGILFNGIDFEADEVQYTTWPWSYSISSFELEQDDNFGIMFGSDIEINNKLFFSVEARFFAEQAISGAFSYKF